MAVARLLAILAAEIIGPATTGAAGPSPMPRYNGSTSGVNHVSSNIATWKSGATYGCMRVAVGLFPAHEELCCSQSGLQACSLVWPAVKRRCLPLE